MLRNSALNIIRLTDIKFAGFTAFQYIGAKHSWGARIRIPIRSLRQAQGGSLSGRDQNPLPYPDNPDSSGCIGTTPRLVFLLPFGSSIFSNNIPDESLQNGF
ncbi:MAG: hypothetical protein L0Y76_07985 [Ignavibacteria bacterium]|nr:hypothetical protein [Ignavibacteria bacterium]